VAYLQSTEDYYKIFDLRSKEAGQLFLELLPCDPKGGFLDEDEIKAVKDPLKDMLNKNLHFLMKINGIKLVNPIYEVN
jgi:hypothetical protein